MYIYFHDDWSMHAFGPIDDSGIEQYEYNLDYDLLAFFAFFSLSNLALSAFSLATSFFANS